MATEGIQGVTGGGRRGPRRRGAGRRVVLAAVGADWSMWVPEDDYNGMTEAERADLARRQSALLEGGAAAAVGASTSTTARPSQLPLFTG